MSFCFTVNPKTNDVDIVYEVDTIEEGIATLNSEGMQRLLAHYQSEAAATPATSAESTSPADNTTAAGKKPRGRPKNQPAPETATAPPPAPIPNAAPTPPVPPLAAAPVPPLVDTGFDGPAALNRNAPPVPPAPPAPPPAAAPSVTLGPKIRAHIEATATDDATKKQYLDWLASPGIGLVIPNVSWDEAMGVLQFTTDAQCGGVAKALNIG